MATRFPTSWEDSDTERIAIAEMLSRAQISSEEMKAVDPPVVQGIFGTKPKKRKKKQHNALTISTVYDHERNDPLVVAIKSWLPGWPKEPLGLQIAIDRAVITINNELDWVGDYINALKWSLFTYHLVLHEICPVRIQKLEIKQPTQEQPTQEQPPAQKFQFGIKAEVDIPPNVFIPELLGLMASDVSTDHSQLSIITPHLNNTGPREPRIMVGPLRFVNHLCDRENTQTKPNIKFVAVSGTAAIVAQTIRPILKGDSILTNYGKDYFGDDCPCIACKGQ